MRRLLSACVAALLLGGCASIDRYRVPPVDIGANAASALRLQPPPAPPINGSIYQAAAYRPLFEDYRARLPGDTLTVQIVEKVAASQSSASTIDHTGKLDASITALPGVLPSLLGRAAATGTNTNNFAGDGSTQSSNDFSGTITVLVTAVLPNGHLLIQGEKQIGLNANVDVLRFSGQVDPRAIQAGNSVQSTLIANVRVEHRSRGQQADAQVMGLMGRFFLNVLPI